MRRLRAWIVRLGGLFHRGESDRELAAEIEAHLQMHIDDNIRAGMSPEQARRDALIKLGGVEVVKENYRDRRGIPCLESLLQDLRFGARMLLKNPGFTLVAVLTVALGVGPNTAIFATVRAVLLEPLPYPEPDRLVTINESDGERDVSVSYLNYQDWIRQQKVFEQIALYVGGSTTLTGRGEAERVKSAIASSNLFSLLGFVPVAGQSLGPEDDRSGSQRKVVLAYGFWQRRFGGDPRVVGQTLVLNDLRYSVAGVMSNRPGLPENTDLWMSLGPRVSGTEYQMRNNHMGFVAVGRLRQGTNLEQARAAMDTIAARLAAEYPKTNANLGVVLIPMLETLVGDYRRPLLLLTAAVAMVLLVASANLANLLFARGAARSRELAVRLALGAGRRRLVRLLLAESALLAVAGGAVGLLLALWSRSAILALAPAGVERFQHSRFDWPVCAFAIVVALLAGLLAGSWPAWRLAATSIDAVMREEDRAATIAPRRRRMRQVLVASEVALTLVLLVSSMLLVRSLVRLQSVPLGFETKNLLMATVDLSPVRYDKPVRINAFYDALLERLRALPGVEAVALDSAAPLDTNWQTQFEVVGRAPFPLNSKPSLEVSVIDPGYFSLMEIPVLRGRPFGREETADGPKAMIVDEALARSIWPGEDAVGKQLRFWQGTPYDMTCTIVGVVPTVRLYGYRVEPKLPQGYFPQSQIGVRNPTVLIRAAGDPAGVAAALRRAVRELDALAPVHSERTLEEDLAGSLMASRLMVWLVTVFAALAMLLAAVGLYGVVSYGVTQQTREIGVRLALGARSSEVTWMVLRQGAGPALIGVVVGLAGALAAARALGSLLYGVSPGDPATFAAVTLLLVAVVCAACYVPARRATQVDPIIALR